MNTTGKPTGVLMRRSAGKTGPILACAACGGRIAASAGVVLWDGSKQDAMPLFSHRGPCCRQLEAEAGVDLDSQPLSVWLVFLANSCRLKWMKAGRLAVAFGSIG